MIQKIKTHLILLVAAFLLAVPMLMPITASAVCSNIGNQVSKGAVVAAGPGATDNCVTAKTDGEALAKLAATIVNLFSIIVGAVAVFMIIYGGFRYITSGGDSGRVGSAKQTLLYAIIGLIIVVLAQLIINFVISQSSTIAQ